MTHTREEKETRKCLISGKYEGYEVEWTDGGQIFPRAGWYIIKSIKGNVLDIRYLEDVLPKKIKKNTFK